MKKKIDRLIVMSIDFNRKKNRGRRLNRTEVDTLFSYRFNNNHDDDDDDENNRKAADCTIRRPIFLGVGHFFGPGVNKRNLVFFPTRFAG